MCLNLKWITANFRWCHPNYNEIDEADGALWRRVPTRAARADAAVARARGADDGEKEDKQVEKEELHLMATVANSIQKQNNFVLILKYLNYRIGNECRYTTQIKDNLK